MRLPRWLYPFRVRDALPAPEWPYGPNVELAACREISKRPSSRPRWDHVPMTGPYRMIRCADDDEVAVHYARLHPTLTSAIADFARLNFPRPGQVCLLVDGDDQALLAWWDRHQGEADLRYGWAGCSAAFNALAEIEPINAALWESLARQEALNC